MKISGSYRFFALAIITGLISCRSIWGDHSLGNNLSLLEGDTKEDRIIIYCQDKNLHACRSGIYVVPSLKRHYDNGNYAEYVEAAKADRDWVIARSVQIKDKKENYWIISKSFDIKNIDCTKNDCDSILQQYVTGPLTITEFENKKSALKISLHF